MVDEYEKMLYWINIMRKTWLVSEKYVEQSVNYGKKINLLYIFGVKSIISNDIYGTIYKFITNNNENYTVS